MDQRWGVERKMKCSEATKSHELSERELTLKFRLQFINNVAEFNHFQRFQNVGGRYALVLL
jgi:hypothetical protein